MKLVQMILVLLMVAPMADAKNNKAYPYNGYCPPGLQRKIPACVPPGQEKKYARGGIFRVNNFDWLANPYDFDLPRLRNGEGYVQIGDAFVKVNKETMEIINLFDALGKVLD
ncbi:MAG: excinuclease ABC subunit A [Paracoccaceae bacterium]